MGYKKDQKLKFINPYTFVPIQRNQPVNRKKLEQLQKEKLYTGVLKCRLRVITPLGIPDAEKLQDISYPFFSYEEAGKKVLAIPGSSLRGSIRSIFEAATDSCFSTLREDTGLSKRTDMRGAYKPGVLVCENEVWHLYRAKRYLMAVDPEKEVQGIQGRVDRNYAKKSFDLERDAYVSIVIDKDGLRKAVTSENEQLHFGDAVEFSLSNKEMHKKNGRPVWAGYARDIKIAENKSGNVPQKGKLLGIVYIGETFVKKKRGESIFVKTDKVNNISPEALKKAYKGLLESLDMYRDSAINKSNTHNGYQGFELAVKKKQIPVWYSEKDKKLSMASIGRTFFNVSLNDLVGERKPCISRKELCEACALFGMAQTESLGSRVRITDGVAVGSYKTNKVCMKILGQPRYSYLPFYGRAGNTNRGRNETLSSYDHEGAEIAGRKFYWHNLAAATDPRIYRTDEKNQMNNTLELVLPGAEFTFDIYYEGITQKQLEKLMWCIHFGENRLDGSLAHKIGRGKPLGLGSVKMVIEEQMERTFENGEYRWITKTPIDLCSNLELKNKNIILKVVNLHTLENGNNKKIPIRYPYIDVRNGIKPQSNNDIASHKWFATYKEESEGRKRLPYITEEDQTLPVYTYVRGNNKRR